MEIVIRIVSRFSCHERDDRPAIAPSVIRPSSVLLSPPIAAGNRFFLGSEIVAPFNRSIFFPPRFVSISLRDFSLVRCSPDLELGRFEIFCARASVECQCGEFSRRSCNVFEFFLVIGWRVWWKVTYHYLSLSTNRHFVILIAREESFRDISLISRN